MQSEIEKQNEYFIGSIKKALEYAGVKFTWYESGHDPYHLKEALDWIEVANIYSKGLKV